MKTFSKASIKTLLLALLAACTLSLHADKVKFVSGGLYQIRTVCRTDGCIMPSSYIEQAITYNIECEGNQVQSVMYLNNGENMMRSVAVDKSAWWVITKDKDGNYTICNAATNRYFTFDGQRTANRRYIYLSTGDHGDKSRWTIYAASIGLGIKNVHIPYHYLDVRLNNHIVGTYGNTSTTLHDNERFFLIDQKGRVVTEFDGEKVNLPKNCFSGNAKTRTYTGKTVGHKAPSVAVTTEVRRIQGNTQQLSFTINGIRPVFNSLLSSHLFAISESKNAKEFTGRIATTEKKGTLFVDGKKVGTGGTFRFTKPTDGHTYRLALVQNNDTVQGAWLTFTFLPVIELTTSSAVSKSSFSPATFRLLDPQHRDTDSTLTAAVRHRGDYATLFPKKAYAVKFVDATGKKQDRHFLDLRTDNYWILDAMAIDHARMRNRVAMDLWNDMDVRPYYAKGKVKTGAGGRLVEVFVNGSYQGIYNFSERIDRKQLNLTKTEKNGPRGLLYKSKQWSTWTLLGYDRRTNRPVGSQPPSFDNASGVWDHWECKYPKVENNHKTDWTPLHDGAALAASASDEDFVANVGKCFDLSAVCNYYLFIELLHATDNSGKNVYWAVGDVTKSKKLTPIPWDLDGIFGRDWGGRQYGCDATDNYRNFLRNSNTQNALFERLTHLNANNWNEMRAKRYCELRRTVFAPDNLNQRFSAYWQLMRSSGAMKREAKKWRSAGNAGLSFEAEADYIKNWIETRVATLDAQYGYK